MTPSSHHVRYERRPSLRHNPAWQSSVSSATGSVHSHAGSRAYFIRHYVHAFLAHLSLTVQRIPPPADTDTFAFGSAAPDKFPWPVVVGPSTSSPSGTGFHVGGSSHKSSRSSNITNLDLLYSLHTTLLTRVTPQEWEALGHGSRAQRKVTRAYEKRCTKMGGGWEGGVRRLDWLHGKTRLIGIEVEKHGNGHSTGKLVFGKA
ncbi:hypothetical protein J3R83DRAFT_5236 [Lanmaoa asiatica]|nr:hypothetical protein J3R83DRAFT_5236 [Lanmaoa asiatica]